MDSAHFDETGRKLFLNGCYEEALETFREGLRLFPADEDLTLGVGMCQVRLGNVVTALETLEPLRARRPDWGDVRLGITDACLKLGRLSDAVVAADEAASKEDDPAFLHEMARLFFDHKRFEEAGALYRKAIALGQNYAPARLGLGACLHRLGRLEEAEREMREAIRMWPEYWAAFQYLGNVLYDRNERQQAKEIFDRVPLDVPWHRVALERRLSMSWRKADQAQRRFIERMLSQAPSHGPGGAVGTFLRKLEESFEEGGASRLPAERFWTGNPALVARNELGAELNGVLALVFERPCSFAPGDEPAVRRLDKHLLERLIAALGEFLECYPWGLGAKGADPFEFSGARALALYAAAAIARARGRLNPAVIRHGLRERLASAAARLLEECAERPAARAALEALIAATRSF